MENIIEIEGLEKSCEKSRMPFCTGCFTGDYGIDDAVFFDKGQLETEA